MLLRARLTCARTETRTTGWTLGGAAAPSRIGPPAIVPRESAGVRVLTRRDRSRSSTDDDAVPAWRSCPISAACAGTTAGGAFTRETRPGAGVGGAAARLPGR